MLIEDARCPITDAQRPGMGVCLSRTVEAVGWVAHNCRLCNCGIERWRSVGAVELVEFCPDFVALARHLQFGEEGDGLLELLFLGGAVTARGI